MSGPVAFLGITSMVTSPGGGGTDLDRLDFESVIELANYHRVAARINASGERARIVGVEEASGNACITPKGFYGVDGGLGAAADNPATLYTLDAVQPWYSPDFSTESAGAYGIITLSMTGRGGENTERSMSPLQLGGGAPSIPVSSFRSFNLRLAVFGQNEESIDYLIDWLHGTLTRAFEERRSARDFDLVWRDRPVPGTPNTNAEAFEGLRMARDCVLMSGPTFLETNDADTYKVIEIVVASGQPEITRPVPSGQLLAVSPTYPGPGTYQDLALYNDYAAGSYAVMLSPGRQRKSCAPIISIEVLNDAPLQPGENSPMLVRIQKRLGGSFQPHTDPVLSAFLVEGVPGSTYFVIDYVRRGAYVLSAVEDTAGQQLLNNFSTYASSPKKDWVPGNRFLRNTGFIPRGTGSTQVSIAPVATWIYDDDDDLYVYAHPQYRGLDGSILNTVQIKVFEAERMAAL